MSAEKPHVYISLDIETNGPIPGSHSMLSLGAAAFTLNNETPFDFFYVKLVPLLRAGADPVTMRWWEERNEAYIEATSNQKEPSIAIPMFYRWLRDLHKYPIAAAYPAGWDYSFIHWYLLTFASGNPMGHSCLDIKTLASALLRKPYRTIGKRDIVKLVGDVPAHTHNALGDAIEQGVILVRLMQHDGEKVASSKPLHIG